MIAIDRNAERTGEAGVRVDLTPMIDVVFTVIAFMMIIINIPVETLDVDLPESDRAAALTETETIVLHVEADAERWRVDRGAPVSAEDALKALKGRMSDLDGDAAILVTIDRDAPAQRMIDTCELLQKGKFEQVSVVTRTPDSGAPAE